MRHLSWRFAGQSIWPAKSLPNHRTTLFMKTAFFSSRRESLTKRHDNTYGNIMKIILFILLLIVPAVILHAQPGYIEVNAPANRQMKLAVDSPRSLEAPANPESARLVSDVITFDMNISGVVTAEGRPQQPNANSPPLIETDFVPWSNAGFDLLVRSEYSLKNEQLTVEFRLFDVINRKLITSKRYLGSARDLRRFSHTFADEILRAITGEKGAFTTRIAYVSTQTGNKEIYVMDWDGHNPLPLTKNGSINLNPDFSPDGREIIFTSYKRGKPDLYRRLLSNTAEVALSSRKGLNITGSWSPDGKQIAFVSDRLGKPQIFIMNADGGDVRRLTTSGSYNVNPRWSPKGDRIAYSRMTNGGFNIFTVAPDGSSDTQLTTDGNNENPSWSADSRLICFSSKRSSGNGVYVMRADGSGQTKVSEGKGAYFQPVWSAH